MAGGNSVQHSKSSLVKGILSEKHIRLVFTPGSISIPDRGGIHLAISLLPRRRDNTVIYDGADYPSNLSNNRTGRLIAQTIIEKKRRTIMHAFCLWKSFRKFDVRFNSSFTLLKDKYVYIFTRLNLGRRMKSGAAN